MPRRPQDLRAVRAPHQPIDQELSIDLARVRRQRGLAAAAEAEQEGPLGRTTGHHRSFLDAIAGKGPPTAPAEAGHRTASICHLNNIAMALGRKLKWDPAAEKFIGDDEANAMLMPKMRPPYTLPKDDHDEGLVVTIAIEVKIE